MNSGPNIKIVRGLPEISIMLIQTMEFSMVTFLSSALSEHFRKRGV
jgi:hypothetical protein